MNSAMDIISIALLSAAGGTLFTFILLWVFAQVRTHRSVPPTETPKADLADLMLLFQTLREIVSQQRELARDFNRQIESRMQSLKELIAQHAKNNDQLYERQQVLVHELQNAQEQLEQLKRDMASMRGTAPVTPATPSPPPQKQDTPSRWIVLPPYEPVQTMSSGADHLRETPENSGKNGNGLEAKNLTTNEVPDTPVVETESSTLYAPWAPTPFTEPDRGQTQSSEASLSAARELRAAYQELVHLEPAPPSPPHENVGMDVLQKRVLDYSAAGMTIAEIARELGMAKGEVRLMLALARQKAQHNAAGSS